MIPAPLFILAPPRSFTSLVCGIIGQHPAHIGLPELNVFQAETVEEFWSGRNPDGSMKSPFWATMRHGLLRAVAEVYAGEQTLDSIEMAERWIWSRRERSTGDVYKELCRKVAPRRVVEKSPAYLRKPAYLDRLIATFPEARFIHLVRHPRSQAESLLKTPGGPAVALMLDSVDHSGGRPCLDPTILWHDGNLQIISFLNRLPRERWIRIRGEAFLADLDHGLSEVCEWLGIPCGPDERAAMKRPQDSPFACLGPANARLGNDVNFLRAPVLREGPVPVPALEGACSWRPDGAGLHDRVVAMARAFGYEAANGKDSGDALAPEELDPTYLGRELGAYVETGVPGDGLPLARITTDPGLRAVAVDAVRQLIETADGSAGFDPSRLRGMLEDPGQMMGSLGGGEPEDIDVLMARRMSQESPFRTLAMLLNRKTEGGTGGGPAHDGADQTDLAGSTPLADLLRQRERLSLSADVMEALLEETCNEIEGLDRAIEAARRAGLGDDAVLPANGVTG